MLSSVLMVSTIGGTPIISLTRETIDDMGGSKSPTQPPDANKDIGLGS